MSHRPRSQAEAAAAASGVVIRTLATVDEFRDLMGLFASIWGRAEAPLVTTELLRALVKSGNYVAGAYAGAELVGGAVAFFEEPAERALHSHIAGVAAQAGGRSVGRALKLHQRAWALERGLAAIVWTYDPLIRRNAHFNLVKLAARPTEYLADFYGNLDDVINGGDRTDRLLVRWDLSDPAVDAAADGRFAPAGVPALPVRAAATLLRVGPDGEPVPGTPEPRTARLWVAVPPDAEALRAADPGAAARWRSAVRDALEPALADGARITGFDPAGWYRLDTQGSLRQEGNAPMRLEESTDEA